MILHFSKNANEQYPNRWYGHIVDRRRDTDDYDFYIWGVGIPELLNVYNKIQELGFKPVKEIIDDDRGGRSEVVYLDFDNEDDEICFIVYASNSIDV